MPNNYKQSDAITKDFIANISHELRTPLTVFRGYLDVLSDQDQVDPEKLQDIVKQMSGQVRRMEHLVQDILMLSRLEHQESIPTQQTIPVATLLRVICEDAKTLGDDQHQFHLDFDEKLKLKAVPDEIYSAFSNIIFNAVRYTPPGGDIFVSWYADENGKWFKVRDSGVGIANEDISRITERFYRVDQARTYDGKGGTGLGLAIVKRVLQRHHAELTIESELGKGSIFGCYFKRVYD